MKTIDELLNNVIKTQRNFVSGIFTERSEDTYKQRVDKRNDATAAVIAHVAGIELEIALLKDELKIKSEETKKLKSLLEFAKEEMTFLEYPPSEDAEFQFCKICNKPDWKHDKDCKGLKWLEEIDALQKRIEELEGER